ncbi:MAG: hypothetical protein IJ223_01230 [Clostridia bacterium]|nr:hypothetical protein [Clostridia bacterium]
MSLEGTINLFGDDNYYQKLIGFAIGIIILGVVCFIDDSNGGVHPLVKLTAQTIAAIVMVISGVRIDSIGIDFINNAPWSETFYTILTIGWIVGITNAINLIDGLDRIIYRCYNNCINITFDYILIKWSTANCYNFNYSTCRSTGWIFTI